MARVVLVAFAASLRGSDPAGAAPLGRQPETHPPPAVSPVPDRITPELQKRIRAKIPLDDVRIDVHWTLSAPTSARVFGNGIGVWNRKLQFRLSKADVIAILESLQKARFGAMPERAGTGSEPVEKKSPPSLKGRISVRVGSTSKSVLQLATGAQSPEFQRLAEGILEICRGPAQKGIGVTSLADGLQKLASRALAPEALEVIVQRQVDRASEASPQPSWILRVEGRRVTDEFKPSAKAPQAPRQLILSEVDFGALVTLLGNNDLTAIPTNVYASQYTDLRVELLDQSRVIAGRRFLGMTPETHGDRQTAFDRIYEGFRALHERVQREGKTASAKPPL